MEEEAEAMEEDQDQKRKLREALLNNGSGPKRSGHSASSGNVLGKIWDGIGMILVCFWLPYCFRMHLPHMTFDAYRSLASRSYAF